VSLSLLPNVLVHVGDFCELGDSVLTDFLVGGILLIGSNLNLKVLGLKISEHVVYRLNCIIGSSSALNQNGELR